MSGRQLAFGPFILDAERRVLLRDGQPVAVGQRGALLLEALLRRPGEVLTKAELMDAAWPGMAVEESNLSVQIALLRKGLQSPENGEWIATIPRVGYRFLGEVTAGERDKPSAQQASSYSGKPSLAVLPFSNLSTASEDEVFADGLTEDIITTLAKLPGIMVIARHSTFAYKGRALDVRRVARELGVRYVLEGSVRKAGDRIRITVQLTEGSTGAHLWAERYDRVLVDMFAIPDDISLHVATEMQVYLTDGEQARLRYTTTSNVEAWTFWMRGHAAAWAYGGLGKEPLTRARHHWEQALALDPNSAPLNAMLAFVHVQDARFHLWDDRVTALGTATGYVERALLLDPDNADAHAFASLICLIQRRFDEALALIRKAVELAPGSADIAMGACWVLTATGHAREAIGEMERAMRLNPHCPPLYLGFLGNAYRLAGRTDEAIAALEEFYARAPAVGLRDLVIAYERAGRHREAAGAAERLLTVQPEFTIAGWIDSQFRCDALDFEADIAALRAAGLPD